MGETSQQATRIKLTAQPYRHESTRVAPYNHGHFGQQRLIRASSISIEVHRPPRRARSSISNVRWTTGTPAPDGSARESAQLSSIGTLRLRAMAARTVGSSPSWPSAPCKIRKRCRARHATNQQPSRERITIGPATVMITRMQLVMEQLQREHTAPVSMSSIAFNSACRHEIVQFARL